jgi:hypothetical protein
MGLQEEVTGFLAALGRENLPHPIRVPAAWICHIDPCSFCMV